MGEEYLDIKAVNKAKKNLVKDLCAVLNMNKSAISHQLKYLRLNHLVKFTKKGKNVFYSHDDEHVSLIIETARRHLSEEE